MSNPRTLLVAATGGHLEQLARISARITPTSGEVTWVTHDDPQSRSILSGEVVHTVPYIPPRGYRAIAKSFPRAWEIVRDGQFDRVISTGAGVALPFFAAARLRGIPCHYIESAARADGPSLTGRIVTRVPGVRLYSQYTVWAGDRWNYRGSLFDSFSAEETLEAPISKVVVTLGTMRTYGFRRVIDRLLTVLPQVTEPNAEILWQTGVTPQDGIAGTVASSVPNAELRTAIAEADLVIAHAGIGSALTALELGQRPLLVPRRMDRGEHVDDHQTLIARELAGRALVVTREADSIEPDDLRRAARGRIRAATSPGPFELVD